MFCLLRHLVVNHLKSLVLVFVFFVCCFNILFLKVPNVGKRQRRWSRFSLASVTVQVGQFTRIYSLFQFKIAVFVILNHFPTDRKRLQTHRVEY